MIVRWKYRRMLVSASGPCDGLDRRFVARGQFDARRTQLRRLESRRSGGATFQSPIAAATFPRNAWRLVEVDSEPEPDPAVERAAGEGILLRARRRRRIPADDLLAEILALDVVRDVAARHAHIARAQRRASQRAIIQFDNLIVWPGPFGLPNAIEPKLANARDWAMPSVLCIRWKNARHLSPSPIARRIPPSSTACGGVAASRPACSIPSRRAIGAWS